VALLETLCDRGADARGSSQCAGSSSVGCFSRSSGGFSEVGNLCFAICGHMLVFAQVAMLCCMRTNAVEGE